MKALSTCAASSTCHLRSCLTRSRSLPSLLAAHSDLALLVTAQGGRLALRVRGQGLVTGMATVVALVVRLVTSLVKKVELLQSSSHHSGALVAALAVVVVQVALAVVAASAGAQPHPQWSELPQFGCDVSLGMRRLILHDGYVVVIFARSISVATPAKISYSYLGSLEYNSFWPSMLPTRRACLSFAMLSCMLPDDLCLPPDISQWLFLGTEAVLLLGTTSI